MKHEDCICAECSTKAAAAAEPKPRITIPLHDAPAVIADSFIAVMRAHGYEVIHYAGLSGAKSLDSDQIAALAREIGRNAAQGLVGLDEPPIEPLPAPVPVRRRGAR